MTKINNTSFNITNQQLSSRNNIMLLRKYIAQRLSSYYNQPSHAIIGTLPHHNPGIKFSHLLGGAAHWRWIYRRIYNQQEGQWMTPCELFRPYYSNCVARFIANDVTTVGGRHRGVKRRRRRSGDDDHPVHILELGAGRGTNARLVLDYLRRHHPRIYERVTYYVVDSSPPLHELQKESFEGEDHPMGKVEFLQRDLVDVAVGEASILPSSDTPTYIIALELLDNLPHDKITLCRSTGALLQSELGPIQTTTTTTTDNDIPTHPLPLTEHLTPLTDPLLLSIIETLPSYAPHPHDATWIPSIACGLMRQLFDTRPNSRCLVADFDYLPPPDITTASSSSFSSSTSRLTPAHGDPLVTCMNGIDHECLLAAPPLCDVLFPTNFSKLAAFVSRQIETTNDSTSGGRVDVTVRKQAAFLSLFEEEVGATRNLWGYTPLLDDFGNCSVLTVSSGGGS